MLLFIFSAKINAQHIDIDPIIKAWKLSDTNQTHASEKIYHDIKLYGSSTIFIRYRDALEAYVKQKPNNKRLHIRFVMYDVLGRQEYHLPVTMADFENLQHCIKQAYLIDDEQLTAELYTLYASINLSNYSAHFVLYNLKALELQRKIGFRHFAFVATRFCNISVALYHRANYKHSIAYGKQGLFIGQADTSGTEKHQRIQLFDIVGASYRKLDRPDSAIYYYQELLKELDKQTFIPAFKLLWQNIARANIGAVQLAQQNKSVGLPAIKEAYVYFNKVNEQNCVAIFGNILASVYYNEGNYHKAVNQWQQALKASEKGSPAEEIKALEGIASCYRQIKLPDSVYRYAKLYYQKKEALSVEESKTSLSQLKAEIQFEDMQHSFSKSVTQLEKEQQTRNFILVGVALLAFIGILIYNRQRIKAHHREEMLLKQMQVETEIAKQNVINLSQNIRYKDKIISEMGKRMLSLEKLSPLEQQNIQQNLLSYVLLTQEDWVEFKKSFNKAYPTFFVQLQQYVQSLTPGEERLASLIFLKLNDQEMAGMLGIGKDSVKRSRMRFRKRLSLHADQNLEQFISSLV